MFCSKTILTWEKDFPWNNFQPETSSSFLSQTDTVRWTCMHITIQLNYNSCRSCMLFVVARADVFYPFNFDITQPYKVLLYPYVYTLSCGLHSIVWKRLDVQIRRTEQSARVQDVSSRLQHQQLADAHEEHGAQHDRGECGRARHDHAQRQLSVSHVPQDRTGRDRRPARRSQVAQENSLCHSNLSPHYYYTCTSFL